MLHRGEAWKVCSGVPSRPNGAHLSVGEHSELLELIQFGAGVFGDLSSVLFMHCGLAQKKGTSVLRTFAMVKALGCILH